MLKLPKCCKYQQNSTSILPNNNQSPPQTDQIAVNTSKSQPQSFKSAANTIKFHRWIYPVLQIATNLSIKVAKSAGNMRKSEPQTYQSIANTNQEVTQS